MAVNDKIKDVKLQYCKQRSKKVVLLSAKDDKNWYLTGEEILPSNRRQIIELGKFAQPPSERYQKTYRKTSWCFKVIRQIDGIFSKNIQNVLIVNFNLSGGG